MSQAKKSVARRTFLVGLLTGAGAAALSLIGCGGGGKEGGGSADKSGLASKQTLAFPLRSPSQTEERMHADFQRQYGHPYTDIEALLDVWYPRV